MSISVNENVTTEQKVVIGTLPILKVVATPASPFVQLHSLVKSYNKGPVVVDDLSFSIYGGEIFGLMGPNGAGKTTLINMLCGVVTPTSGTATIGGYDLVRQSKQVKQLIGIVPQDLALYPMLNAYDNLIFFGKIYGLGGRLLKERIEQALEIVGLSDRARQRVETFSGGMKRRINIAAALLHRPKLLILDEPTVGVDPQSRAYIFESVRRLNREYGMTVIYTTHYMEEIQTLCGRVAIVDHGKLIALDTKEALIANYGSGLLYLGLDRFNSQVVSRLAELSCIEGVEVLEESADEVPTGLTALAGDEGKVICCKTNQTQNALLQVIPTINGLGLKLTSLEIGDANLEAVFLKLTGKKLRE